ncbi:MAG TPA: hypothetical protein VGO67_12100 [Verrucomicrobiae bacterium]|jgi:hypothetical protein
MVYSRHELTPTNEQDRAQVGKLTDAVQAVGGGIHPSRHRGSSLYRPGTCGSGGAIVIHQHVIRHHEATRFFALLPSRWVKELSIGWGYAVPVA